MDKMGRSHSTHENLKFNAKFGQKNWKKRKLERRFHGRIILQRILQKEGVRMWNVISWLKMFL